MRKIGMKQLLGFAFVLFLLEVLILFFIPNKYISILALLVLNLFLINRIIYLIRRIEISNTEKIRAASRIAEKSLDYAFNEVSVGIINYDPDTKEAKWLNPFAEDIFKKDGQSLLSPELIQNYLSLADKGKDIFKVGEHVYRFNNV